MHHGLFELKQRGSHKLDDISQTSFSDELIKSLLVISKCHTVGKFLAMAGYRCIGLNKIIILQITTFLSQLEALGY